MIVIFFQQEMKQSEIRKLAKLNSSARQKLQLQRSEVHEAVKAGTLGGCPHY
jgi:hypothetical protein